MSAREPTGDPVAPLDRSAADRAQAFVLGRETVRALNQDEIIQRLLVASSSPESRR